MLIGITGESGSGKTTVANYIAETFDIGVIHGDDVAHEVLTLEVYNEVLSWFNVEPKTSVDRKFLGKLLFQDASLMKKYNDYIYQLIRARITEMMNETAKRAYVIDWNFLPITNLFNECSIKILLKAPVSVRRSRVMKRDGIDQEYFNLREANGLKYDNEKIYDFVFVNENRENLENGIKKALGGISWK